MPFARRFSSWLSAIRPRSLYANHILHKRAYATRTPFRGDTILTDSDQRAASTCWSLFSPSSSVIASELPSLKLRKATLTSGKTPLVVLLVTPAHIRLLEPGSPFIPSLLRLAIENPKTRQEFDLLAAVVDRIPQTSSTASHRSRGSHAADVAASPQTCVEDGLEGISVAVLDSGAAAPDLWSPKNTINEQETMTIQQRCTLSFSLPPSPGVRTEFPDKPASQPLVQRMLQLPVANTIFQNGRMSTLFAQRWQVSFQKESTLEHLSSEKAWLSQQVVHLDTIFADEDFRLLLDTLMHSHLVPLTPARTIKAAVGNIVREVSGSDASAEVVPASEELERAISTAIQHSQTPIEQAGVWALIRPQKYATLDLAAQSNGTVRDMVEYAILTGARLHKVLSGGGGWGEKHGLLALDPDSNYSHQHRAFEPAFVDNEEAEVANSEALGEVAKPGDIITFYVCRSPLDASPSKPRTPLSWSSSRATSTALVFGSIPSTMDAMRENDCTEAVNHAQSELTVEENRFGMLSEQGMSLESSFLITNVPASRMQYLRPRLHKNVYTVRRKYTLSTKLDAPYTMLSIQGQTSRIPTSSEVKGGEFQTQNMHLQHLMPPEPPTAAAETTTIAALVQKLPKLNDQKQEAQRLAQQKNGRADRMLAKLQGRIEEEVGKLSRKEQRAKGLKVSKAQPATAMEMDRRIVKEAKNINERHSARTRAKEGKQKAQRQNLRQRNRNTRQTHDNSTPITVRFTSPEPGSHRKVILHEQVASPQILYQKDGFAAEHRFDAKIEQESKFFPDEVKDGGKPDSVSIIKEESEGKDPGTPYKGKEGNIFVVRKHLTRNPFERLQAIKQVGEITSRDRAMGLHGQYHLALENQPGEQRTS